MMGYVKLGTQLGILEADNARLREQVADLTAKLAMVKRHAGLDCGDSSCMFAMKISGMRTNGGCRCNPKRWKQDLEESYARISDLTRRLEEAERKNDEFFKEWKACRDVMRGKVNDPDPLVPCGDERDLTLFGMVSGVLRSRDALKTTLAAVERERDAAKERVRDLIAKLDILSKYVWCETGEFGFPDGDVIQVRKGRNYTDLRTALLRLAQAMRGM